MGNISPFITWARAVYIKDGDYYALKEILSQLEYGSIVVSMHGNFAGFSFPYGMPVPRQRLMIDYWNG